jgi:hypothetical protein
MRKASRCLLVDTNFRMKINLNVYAGQKCIPSGMSIRRNVFLNGISQNYHLSLTTLVSVWAGNNDSTRADGESFLIPRSTF